MLYIRLVLKLSNIFIFLLSIYALLGSNHMISSMYGPVSIELENLNMFFGLALLLSSILLYRFILLNSHSIFLCITLLFFFSFAAYMVQSKVVEIALGPLFNYYKFIIYSFVFSFFTSVIYLLKFTTDSYFLKQKTNKKF